MLTQNSDQLIRFAEQDQILAKLGDLTGKLLASLKDKDTLQSTEAQAAQPLPSKASGAVKRLGAGPRKRKTKRKGGWPSRTGLNWGEVQQVFEFVKVARTARNPLTALVTINPGGDDDDAGRKRFCSRKIAHLGQALRRRGQKHVGVTTFEKEVNGKLHAHHLVHILPRNMDILQRMADGEIIHFRKSVPTDPAYITKHRLPGSPEFEAYVGHKRRKGAPIRGQRSHYTRAAKDLLKASHQKGQKNGSSR